MGISIGSGPFETGGHFWKARFEPRRLTGKLDERLTGWIGRRRRPGDILNLKLSCGIIIGPKSATVKGSTKRQCSMNGKDTK